MRKINGHIVFIAILLILSLFFLKSVLHRTAILDNVHYINDLTFLSYNTKESIKNNELPLWTPYFYAGHPLLAIPENYMFDLNFLLIYLFKDIYLAMNISLIFYFFLAGVGMYLMVYSILNNKMPAFISAIIYMFNGFMHSFIMHGHINILEGYALMPFTLLFIYKAIKCEEWLLYSILAGIFFALQIVSGSMILFFYTALLGLFYLALNLLSKNFAKLLAKSLFIGIVIIIVSLSLAAIKFLPVLEFTKMSSRATGISLSEYLGEPINLSSMARVIITDFGYSGLSGAVGVIGFILLIFGLFDYKKKMAAFSIAVIIFSILFASGTFIADAMYKIPGFDRLRHVERALVLFVFAASVLSAYGFALLSEKLKRYSKYSNLLFAGIALLILLELMFLHNAPASTKVIEPSDMKALEYMGDDKSAFRTINLGLKEAIGAAGYNYYAQKGISEVKGGGGIWVNEYAAFVSVAQQSINSKILGVLNVKYIVSDRPLEASNITYVNKFNECKDCAVGNAFGPYLYKNDDFLPRYYVAPNSVLVVGNKQLVKQLIYSFMLQNLVPKNMVLIEGTNIDDYDADFLRKFDVILLLQDSIGKNSIDKLREYAAQGGVIAPDILNQKNSVSNDDIKKIFGAGGGNYKEINIDKYSNNKVVLDLRGEKGWLVASERFAHFPGWKAGINGRDIKIFKADGVISALYVNGEKGKLIFEYEPESYSRGKLISIYAMLIIIAYLVYYAYRKGIAGDKNKA